jgi:hypothetical protein
MPTGIISGKSYRIVNKGAHLALDFDTGNHKSILGDNPEPVETQAVRITFPVSTYCSTHVLVVDHRAQTELQRGNHQIRSRPRRRFLHWN